LRIWIINPFDELPNEPGRPGRFWSLCHVLAGQGHEVVWWTADFSHRRKVRRAQPAQAKPETGDLKPEAAESSCLSSQVSGLVVDPTGLKSHVPSLAVSADRFEVRLVPVSPYRANVGWARLRSHRLFGRNLEGALRAETAAGRRPDRIVASWPPVEAGEVAVRLGREWGVPVTIDVMDAWPEAFASFIPGPAWVARLMLAPWRRRARKVFAAAERVSGVGRAFLDYARELGAKGPVHLTYLGAWFAEKPGAQQEKPETGNLRPEVGGKNLGAEDSELSGLKSQVSGLGLAPSGLPPAPLRLLYLGNIGRSQDLASVVAGVARLRARGHDVLLDVAGSGEYEAELERAVRAAGLGEAVRLHGFLTGAELDALVAGAHVGVNPVRGESFIACPYKVADYLAAGLPVLNSLPGELADLLAQYGAGRQFAAGDAESFAVAVEAWVKAPETVAKMSADARRLGEDWFAREKTYPELARFVAGGGRRTVTEDGRRRAEGRRTVTEDGRRRTEGRRTVTEGGGRRTD
jgi:glycosyltransferase involved in cell wall biosynthesis